MSTAVALVNNNSALPAYASKNTGRGNEEVGANHVTIPRIKLLQKMSDEVDRHHANYVDGAKDGDFLNSLTRENYGDSLYVIPIKFKEEFAVWRKRDAGGGLIGTFKTEADARAAIAANEKPQDLDLVQGHSHILLVKNAETGELSKPVIMDFTSSKLRISRNWNSQIDLKGGDRFTGLWKLTSVAAKAKNGAQFMNLEVAFVGWAQEEDYKTAENYYTQFAGK
mgnify:CR=1 FL=1